MDNDNIIPSSMFLKNIRCPKCESLAPFEFGPMPVTLKVHDNNIDTIGLVRWSDEDAIRCCKCGHHGVVGDFRGKAMPDDYNMNTVDGNEIVANMVCLALEAMEQGRRSADVNALLQQSIELIHVRHPEVTSLTVRDSIYNALAPAYRQRYGIGLPYDVVRGAHARRGFPPSQNVGRGECP